ncbi:uncharacterized protein LOC143895180 [Temnothorax americanus]|uniref:uncharacterized protein LOC143895180 n=1 Tax=Temnothorax americanus TaxID=1964332 RepID=UPI004067BE35
MAILSEFTLYLHLSFESLTNRKSLSLSGNENDKKLNFECTMAALVICPDCGRTCQNVHLLRRECLKERKFICSICSKAFRRNPETDREEDREAAVREELGEEADDLQMHEMHQELSIGNVLAKTSEIGVRH